MMEFIYRGRAKVIHFFYRWLLKPIFFQFDPERVHDFMTTVGVVLGSNPVTRTIVRWKFAYRHPMLEQTIVGVKFLNPVGLSAGFDKDAHLTNILPSVGFGFVEVGSITAEPSRGNPKPRLWRLPKSKSLVVYYGLKNDGCEVIANRLRQKKFVIPVGTSVAMTNCQKNLDQESAINDYATAFLAVADLGAYTTVNVSCPNALGGQPFSDNDKLDQLLSRLDTIVCAKPIFLKLSPDLSPATIDGLLAVARRHRVAGFVISNLTKNRQNEAIQDQTVPDKGGLSGKAVEQLSNQMIDYIYRRAGQEFIIIGCGGIFSADDAYQKIRLGASLLQLITGMIYEGPQLIGAINQGLVARLRQDGFTNISQAIGADSRTNASSEQATL